MKSDEPIGKLFGMPVVVSHALGSGMRTVITKAEFKLEEYLRDELADVMGRAMDEAVISGRHWGEDVMPDTPHMNDTRIELVVDVPHARLTPERLAMLRVFVGAIIGDAQVYVNRTAIPKPKDVEMEALKRLVAESELLKGLEAIR